MKFISFITLLLVSVSVSAQPGQLTFEKKTIELPALKADSMPTTVTFTAKNTGHQPVIISQINPVMPQLIKIQWDKKPIAPGEKTEIKVSFISKDIPTPDQFSYGITLITNAIPARDQLRINGNIIDNPAKPDLLYKINLSGLKFKNNHVFFNNIYSNQTVKDSLYFFNTRDSSVNISTRYTPAHIKITAIPQTVAPRQKGLLILTYNATVKNDFGYTYDNVILKFNNDNSYNNRISVSAKIVEDFSKLTPQELETAPVAVFEKTSVEFGEIKPGDKANCDFVLVNKGKSDLIIRKTKASCGCTAVTLGENIIAPGKTTTIRATFNSAGKTGRQYKTITVITNDPKHPETNLTISGTIASK